MKHIAKKIFAAIGSAALLSCAAFAPALNIIKDDATLVASALSWTNPVDGVTYDYVQDYGGVAITLCKNTPQVENLTIPNQIAGQDVVAIYADSFNRAGTSKCNCIQNLNMPNTIRTIGNNFFKNCDGLMHVTLSTTLLTIGNYCFYDADGLKEMNVPNSVKSIGTYFCNWAYGLEHATLGSGIEILGAHAFARTPKLQDFNSSTCTLLKTIREGILVSSKWANNQSSSDALYIGPNNKILLRYQRKNTNSYVELSNNVRILADKAFNDSSWTYGSYITEIVGPRVEQIGDNVFGKVPNATVRFSATLMYTTYGNGWYNTVTAKVSPATFVPMH